ncbi:MAG: hypothetical protein M9887_00660 [Chitinophagales bacterium]|nr:hypothetical protein [Chitinophagales bacterium]
MWSILEAYRLSLFRNFVQRKMDENVFHQPLSLHHSKSIGILFEVDLKNDDTAILSYAENLKSQGKEVRLLGFLKERNRKINYLFPYISKKDVNWFGKPKGGTIGFFIKNPFDILINFAPKENLPFEYVSTLSRAVCRIGFNERNSLKSYDCILLTEKEHDICSQINSLDKYLL